MLLDKTKNSKDCSSTFYSQEIFMNLEKPQKEKSGLGRLLKIVIISFLVLAALFIFLVGAIPTIISTDWGQKHFIKLINGKIPGKISAKNLQVSWLGGQHIENFELKDPSGTVVLSYDLLSTDTSLFKMLFCASCINSAELVNLNAAISWDNDGLTNWQKALLRHPTPNKHLKPMTEPIIITNVNGKLASSSPTTSIHGTLKGMTKQGNLSGSFDLDATFPKNGIDITQLFNPSNTTERKVSINISKWPVATIDSLLMLSRPDLAGILTAGLGNQLDLNIDQSSTKEGIVFNLKAKSPTLNADLAAVMNSEKLQLSRPAQITMTITPTFLEMLAKQPNSLLSLALGFSNQASLTIDSFSLPFDEKKHSFDLTAMALQAKLTLPQVDLNGNPKLDLSISTSANEGKKEIVVKANTPNLSFPNLVFSLDNELKLLNPATVQLKVSPATANRLLFGDQGALQFKDDISIKLAITAFKVPLSFIFDENQRDLNLASEVILNVASKVEPFEIWHRTKNGSIAINDLQFELSGPSLAKENVLISGTLEPSLDDRYFKLLMGRKADFKLKSNIDINEQGTLSLKEVVANINGDFISGHIEGELLPDGKIVVPKPTQITYTLTNETMDLMGLKKYPIKDPSKIVLTINPFEFICCRTHLNELYIDGRAELDKLAFIGSPTSAGGMLRQLTIPWEINGKNNTLKISMTGNASIETEKESGTIDGKIQIDNWHNRESFSLKNSTITFTGACDKFPTAVVEVFTKMTALPLIIGPSMAVNFDGRFVKAGLSDGHLNLKIQGHDFLGNFALKFQDGIVLQDQKDPFHLEFKLTQPLFYAFLTWMSGDIGHRDHIRIVEPSSVTLKVDVLRIPWRQTIHGLENQYLREAIVNSAYIMNLTADKLHFKDLDNDHAVVWKDVVACLQSNEMDRRLELDLKAQQYHKGSENKITCKAILENGFAPSGQINIPDSTLSIDIKLHRFPGKFLCDIACINKDISNKVEALLGEEVDAEVRTKLHHLSGPLYVTSKGSNGSLILDAQFKRGILTLNKTFEAEFIVTPQLGQSVLQDLIPILGGAISSDKPIRAMIDSHGFSAPLLNYMVHLSIPLANFDITLLQIGRATLDLGKIQFRKESQLGSIVSILKPTIGDQLSVWFTPMYYKYQKGIANIARMDMLVMDKYPFAIWGKVDMITDKVDLTVGVSGKALSQAFDLKGLDDSYMMQIPLKGTTNNPTLDKAKATARIAALLAQLQGTSQGKVIGTFLDIAGGSLKEAPPPIPTTSPLPWETGKTIKAESPKETTPAPEPVQKQNQIQDHIEKEANKFLQKFLK